MRGLRGLGIQGLANPVFSAGCPGGAAVGLGATILSYNPIAYWPMNELSGLTAINYGSLGAAANGTYLGVDLAQTAAPGGGLAPRWGGSGDYLNIYSAALSGSFPGTLGTLFIWYKVTGAYVWVDGAIREHIRILVNGTNNILLRKMNTNNTISAIYTAGGTSEYLDTTAYNNTNWNMSALTWTDAGDEVKWFVNGTQIGATQTGIGTFAGALSATQTAIGATGTSPGEVWDGYLSHCALYSAVLTQPELATVYAAG